MPNAYSTVPTPTVPPRSQPTASTRGFDRRADQPHRKAGAHHESGHQAVARAGAQRGADVEDRAERVEHNRAHHHRDAHRKRGRRRQQPQPGVDGDRDDDDVGDRADARPVPQRNPGQQHRDTDHRGRDADGHAGVTGQSLVEDVPRVQAQPGTHHHGHREAVAAQTDEQRRPRALRRYAWCGKRIRISSSSRRTRSASRSTNSAGMISAGLKIRPTAGPVEMSNSCS